MVTGFWGYISAGIAVAIAVIIVAMALAVVWALFTGKIQLDDLLAEPAGPNGGGQKASISRFQLLIFTFVIAGVYLVLCLENGTFVALPENVVLLLGVSGGTYAASKGIKAAGDAKASENAAAAIDANANQNAAAAGNGNNQAI